MLSKYVWDNVVWNKLLVQCWPRAHDHLFKKTLHKETTCKMLTQSAQTCFYRKIGCSFKCLVVCFLTSPSITKQSWLFLFNAGSGDHLWLAGQQWTLANIDWGKCYIPASIVFTKQIVHLNTVNRIVHAWTIKSFNIAINPIF